MSMFHAIALEGGYCPAGTDLGVFCNQYDADCVAAEYDVEWFAVPINPDPQEVEDADYVASLNFPEEQTALNDEDADQPVRKPGKVRTSKRDRKFSMSKQERHVRKSHDRMHGKKRKPSAKNMRRWENCVAQMGRAQVMWHESCTGEIVPVPVDRKYHDKRYLPVDMPTECPFDWNPWAISDALPDPLPEEQKNNFWESWDFFCRTTNVRIENAEIWKTRFGNAWHFVLEETGTVYWEDENGQHASDWERETVIY